MHICLKLHDLQARFGDSAGKSYTDIVRLHFGMIHTLLNSATILCILQGYTSHL